MTQIEKEAIQMEIIPLLGKQLKDDEIIEILEWMEMDVHYDFDRVHEGTPDKYWAGAEDHGILFRFDEAQTLDTIFLYVRSIDDYSPVDPESAADIQFFASIAEVEADATTRGLHIAKSAGPVSLSPSTEWIRIGCGDHHVHYEFRDGELTRVTVMRQAP